MYQSNCHGFLVVINLISFVYLVSGDNNDLFASTSDVKALFERDYKLTGKFYTV